jgi:hypothetical protein
MLSIVLNNLSNLRIVLVGHCQSSNSGAKVGFPLKKKESMDLVESLWLKSMTENTLYYPVY